MGQLGRPHVACPQHGAGCNAAALFCFAMLNESSNVDMSQVVIHGPDAGSYTSDQRRHCLVVRHLLQDALHTQPPTRCLCGDRQYARRRAVSNYAAAHGCHGPHWRPVRHTKRLPRIPDASTSRTIAAIAQVGSCSRENMMVVQHTMYGRHRCR